MSFAFKSKLNYINKDNAKLWEVTDTVLSYPRSCPNALARIRLPPPAYLEGQAGGHPCGVLK